MRPARSTGRSVPERISKVSMSVEARRSPSLPTQRRVPKRVRQREIPLDSPEIDEIVTSDQKAQLLEEIELLDGASAEFDQELVSKGELSPVFFGSALTNFGVEIFLKHFLKMTTSPLPRTADMRRDRSDERGFFCFCI